PPDAIERISHCQGSVLGSWLLSKGGSCPLVVIQQSSHDKVQQAKSELRVLKIEFLDLIVADCSSLHIRLAADSHGAPAIRCEQSDFAQQRAGATDLVDFDDFDLAGNYIERFSRVFPALHHHIVRLVELWAHVFQQPINVHITLDRGVDVADEFQHLVQSPRVQRKKQGIEDKGGIGA